VFNVYKRVQLGCHTQPQSEVLKAHKCTVWSEIIHDKSQSVKTFYSACI